MSDPFFERENKKHIDWLLERAKSGDVFAVFTFAEYLHEGILVDKDVDEAAKWYKLAADEGHAGAIEKLRKMFVDGEISETYVPPPYIPPKKRKSSTPSFFSSNKKSSKKNYDGNFGDVDAGLAALFNDEKAGYEENTFHFKESYGKKKHHNKYNPDEDFDDFNNNDDD